MLFKNILKKNTIFLVLQQGNILLTRQLCSDILFNSVTLNHNVSNATVDLRLVQIANSLYAKRFLLHTTLPADAVPEN